jgi:hypothetical protein
MSHFLLLPSIIIIIIIINQTWCKYVEWERIREGVRQTPSHFPTKNTRYCLIPLAPSTVQKTHILRFLFYPSLYPQRESNEQEKKFLSDQFLNETSLFYFERNFFFLPTSRTQQAKGLSISTRILFLTHNEKAASKGLFHFYQNFFSYPQLESSKQRAFPSLFFLTHS